MHWNHRVIHRVLADYEHYAIHEVYYDEANKPVSCTLNAAAPFGETLDELIEEVKRFRIAAELPVLEYDEIGGE